MLDLYIKSIYLKNFVPFLSGMGKHEIYLDFENVDKVINLIIGPMGSGKTYLLSHLQPFANVGTLDVRSHDDPIIEGENGKKIIVYQHGFDTYEITHRYNWNGKSHTIKSYIVKNEDEDLNPNGNQFSFKDIIYGIFGIDIGYLRLLRIGSNVTNFIGMSSTERKQFLSLLLQDTEIYNFLNKKWSEEMRAINTKVSVLSNKLSHIGGDSLARYEEEYTDNEEIIVEMSDDLYSLNEELHSLYAEAKVILNNVTPSEYSDQLKDNKVSLQRLTTQMENIKQEIDSMAGSMPLEEINRLLGHLDQKEFQLTSDKEKHIDELTAIDRDLTILRDKRLMAGNKEHMEMLQTTFDELSLQSKGYQETLDGFFCQYSSSFMISFIDSLQNINIIINDIMQYTTDDVRRVYNSDSTVINYAKKKVEILTATKFKRQKEMNNIKFSENYEAPVKMYRPPFCPTESCPYYKHHPHTIQKENCQSKSQTNERIEELQQEVASLDVDIYRYSDYPYIYSKITTFRELWNKAFPVLDKLQAIRNRSPLMVLTNLSNRYWYDYDVLIEVLDKLKIREQSYELNERVLSIQNELNILKMNQDTSVDEKIASLEEKREVVITNLDTTEKELNQIIIDIKDLNEMYLEVSNLSSLQSQFSTCQQTVLGLEEQIGLMEKNLVIYSEHAENIKRLNLLITEKKNDISKYTASNEKIKATINDIKYTQAEYTEVLQDKEYMGYLVKATGSKEGIPLVMVKIFLDSCRDIINDLIYTVCEDQFEILDFKIEADEFKIPYMYNGVVVDDISKASQGQSSIASVALSFALVRQSSFDYNIMLLDEVDGPLYKSDRNKFISILLRQLDSLGAKQTFLISHNNTFEGYPINVIMTGDEIINQSSAVSIMKV